MLTYLRAFIAVWRLSSKEFILFYSHKISINHLLVVINFRLFAFSLLNISWRSGILRLAWPRASVLVKFFTFRFFRGLMTCAIWKRKTAYRTLLHMRRCVNSKRTFRCHRAFCVRITGQVYKIIHGSFTWHFLNNRHITVAWSIFLINLRFGFPYH